MIEKIQQVMEVYEPQLLNRRSKASVLIPLIKVKNEWHLLYQVRSQNVSQAGDSSFPGGGVEPGESFEEAAIRETMEELNLARKKIKVFGEMDYLINRKIEIHAFVGQILDVSLEDIVPNDEVEEIYTIPVKYFLENEPSYFSVVFEPAFEDPSLKQQKERNKNYQLLPAKEHLPYYDKNNHLLYGLTADLTARFIEIIKQTFI